MKHRGAMLRWAAAAIAVVALVDAAMAAELPSKEQPVLLSADEVSYDQDLGVVTARGHVELSQGDRILLADTVSYNERSATVAASGNVSLLEPNGDVAFANYVELTSDLKEGVIRDIRALLSDGSRIAANGGRRSGDTTEFAKAVYSPCPLCAEDPTRAPMWQLKAVRVTHDQQKHRIYYRDAWMEIYGVPVVYMPYFSHPDPTVKRQTGLLVPEFSFSDSLGAAARVPYFITLGPSADLTLLPIITTKQGVVLGGEYRRRFQTGEVELDGSATQADREKDNGTDENTFRGHINGKARFDLNEDWRWGADLQRASDKTYRRLYDYGSERTLTTQAFVENFNDRSYGLARSMWFQGLRDQDNNDQFPLIWPEATYDYVGEPWGIGNYFTFDAGVLNLTRVEGRDSRRVHSLAGWHLPFTSRYGYLVNLATTLQADGYYVEGVDPNDPNNVDPTSDTKNGTTGRIFPQISGEVRYPLVQYNDRFTQVLEPIGALIVAPNDSNPNLIPNEDSQDFELDETNLFKPNRSTGIDFVDSGQRVDYGLEWSAYGADGGALGALVGQSYRFSSSQDFAAGSGIENSLSDIVGRIDVAPYPELDIAYRFRLDNQTLASHRNELLATAGTPDLNLRLSYLFLDDETATQEFGDRQEVYARLRGRISGNWNGVLFARRDLESDHFLSYGLGLNYEGACVSIGAEIRHEEFRDNEINPETKFLIRISFKTLGGVEF